jgi:hypothetical protein
LPGFAVTEISLAVALALYAEAGRQDTCYDLAQCWWGVPMLLFWIHDGRVDFLGWPAGTGASLSCIGLFRSMPGTGKNTNWPGA